MDTDNASLLTNATAALQRYRDEERSLEMERAVLDARLEIVREIVTALSGKPRTRRGRPPKVEQQQDEPQMVCSFEEAAA